MFACWAPLRALKPSLLISGALVQNIDQLYTAITAGDSLAQRRAIAKAITLLESTRTDHREQADLLLTRLLPHSG